MDPRSQVVALSMLAALIMGIPTAEGNHTTEISLLNHYNESELACYQQLKVQFTNGNCYHLLTRGPCTRGEWLVLNEEQETPPGRLKKSHPICRPKPCRSGQVFWSESNRCRSIGREKEAMCPYRGVRVTDDWWGEGKCACEGNNVRLEADVLNGKDTTAEIEGDCYPLYQQGNCTAGHVLTPVLHDGQVVGRCSPNACDNSRVKNPGSSYAQLSPPDGPCHELGATGPCSTGQKFVINPITKEPGCVSLQDGNSVDLLSAFSDTSVRCDGNFQHNSSRCRIPLNIVQRYILPNKSRKFSRRLRKNT